MEVQVKNGIMSAPFADFQPPAEGEEWDGMEKLGQIIALPGDVILVCNAGDVSLEA